MPVRPTETALAPLLPVLLGAAEVPAGEPVDAAALAEEAELELALEAEEAVLEALEAADEAAEETDEAVLAPTLPEETEAADPTQLESEEVWMTIGLVKP